MPRQPSVDDRLESLRHALKYGSKYRDSMCITLIDMFKQGKTKAQFCAAHDIAGDTFHKWLKGHKLFAYSYEIAKRYAQAYYDELRQTYTVEEHEGAKINWANFNRMYNTRFNIPEKRAVAVKGLSKAKDERAMLKALTNAVENKKLTPDEAGKLAGIIDVSLKIKMTQELEQRVEALEAQEQTGLSNDDFGNLP